MGSPRVGSDPTGVVRVQGGFVWKANTLQVWPGLVRRDGTRQAKGLFWELNPGPLAPEARIMPLDQTANGAHVSSGTCNYCSPCCQPHGSAG